MDYRKHGLIVKLIYYLQKTRNFIYFIYDKITQLERNRKEVLLVTTPDLGLGAATLSLPVVLEGAPPVALPSNVSSDCMNNN